MTVDRRPPPPCRAKKFEEFCHRVLTGFARLQMGRRPLARPLRGSEKLRAPSGPSRPVQRFLSAGRGAVQDSSKISN